MRLRSLFVKDVSVRLTENGFVETVRWFGLPTRSVHYELADSEPGGRAAREGRSIFARVRARREANRPL